MTALATDSGRKTPARLAGSAILGVQSDERLVALVRSGHERAFEAIVKRYRRQLIRFCRRILPDSRCEDAVQQAFINAHAALIASDEPLQLKPWLFAVTRNAALNIVRQNGWNYEQIPADFDSVPRPDQVLEQRAELQRTVDALNELPERQRDALVMREFEGRSYDEIALALGAGDGAVRQLLNRARVTLRNAVSLLVPPPLVARVAASMPPSDGRRTAEILGGLGAAGIAKAGATAVVAGSLVVGAVKAPLPIGDGHKTTREKATLTSDKPAARPGPARDVTASLHAPRPTGRGVQTPVAAQPTRRSESDDSGRSGHSGSSGRDDSAGDTRERSSGGDHRSQERSVSDDSGKARSEDRSGSSGGSGSDDAVATPLAADDHAESSSGGSSGSGSDDSVSSGSGSSGSGSSGSGSSGSGSADSGSSGSDSSASSDTTETVEP
ncbi:MAG TPA: sigma-70 family RNA polymerase sigma factor [Thermoleophilaceae bacterium]|jgi:RNA polymerase sigma factor (sigma-70 family)|nr:sigma-70 family RNA polymerase sigma factor [Thermoleophilaceae bacterium]